MGGHMCRLNLVLINKKEVENILSCEDYDKIFDDLMGFMAYQKGLCNCDSFVGSVCEEKGTELGFLEITENRKQEEIKRLYQIRDFMMEPDYPAKRQEYIKQRSQLQEELDSLSSPITDYELDQLEIIEENYRDDEYDQKLEELNQIIGKQHADLESSFDYQEKWNAYQQLMNENLFMEDSTLYYLSEEEVESDEEGFSLEELFGDDFVIDDEEVIEIEESSRVIGKRIEEEENITFEKEIKEFDSYCNLFNKLLEKTDSILFTTIWSEPGELKQVKEISVNDLKIDDLAFLDYDEMLCITR